jgi:hypothetical protein
MVSADGIWLMWVVRPPRFPLAGTSRTYVTECIRHSVHARWMARANKPSIRFTLYEVWVTMAEYTGLHLYALDSIFKRCKLQAQVPAKLTNVSATL